MARDHNVNRGPWLALHHPWIRLFVVVALVFAGVGCEPTQRVVRDDWGTWADQMRAGGAAVTTGGQARGSDSMSAELAGNRAASFAILLAMHDSDDRGARAFDDAAWARQQGIAQVWSTQGDGVVSVYAGRFGRLDDPKATALAKQVRGIERGEDDVPFANAKVVRLSGIDAIASGDPHDLRTHSGRFEYSVQIGFFDAAFPGDRYQAAEAWVRQLREEGQQSAYYYHGPHRSMVTVGLFNRRDFVRQGYTEVPGPEIEKLREKYPHNLGNGMTLMQKSPEGKSLGEQRSFVVRVP